MLLVSKTLIEGRKIRRQLKKAIPSQDRSLLTSILEPGELIRPVELKAPEKPWHLNTNPIKTDGLKELADDIASRLNEIQVVYFRPYPWLPALRLEMSRSVAKTPARLASVLQAVKHQCGAPAMMEPYPLYMADRMVKSLATAIPTFRQITSQHMAETYQGSVADIFLGLHGYRTESGR